MALYRFHEMVLEVMREPEDIGEDLTQLLQELSWVRVCASGRKPCLYLSVSMQNKNVQAPRTAREVFSADGFSGIEDGGDFYLTDGASLLHLQTSRGRADAHLSPLFLEKPATLRHNFWAFGLLRLLRPRGFYSLHAAGVVAWPGQGLLIVGASGRGKSTLAIGLIRHGWGYLSDDAVLLRQHPEGVEAFACRKHFYIDAEASAKCADLPLGDEVPDSTGGRRRRVGIEKAFPSQRVARCVPRVLLFSRIVPDACSALIPLDQRTALGHLLAQSGPQLFDRVTMPTHLAVLLQLVRQSTTYELLAGRDLYQDPLTLVRLLREAEGGAPWLAS
jgi:hypothetical protein